MPEYPDVTVYLRRLEALLRGQTVRGFRNASPFLVRTVDPPISGIVGAKVLGFERLGKRIVWALDDDRFLSVHLMIAGRLRWHGVGAKIPAKVGLCAWDFDQGTLILTEASTQKRAALHLVRGQAGLDPLRREGLEVFEADEAAFVARLRSENHTLKRALTDPDLFSGIGNAYSDEILHHAGLSPVTLTARLGDPEAARLFDSTRQVLTLWTERLDKAVGQGFPDKVTAFHEEMAVHGRFGQPCPRCGALVQRIVHGSHETNYCPSCQTGGKLLADRALSALLKKDWPKTLEELEERRQRLTSKGSPP